jgi:hypothetical protein
MYSAVWLVTVPMRCETDGGNRKFIWVKIKRTAQMMILARPTHKNVKATAKRFELLEVRFRPRSTHRKMANRAKPWLDMLGWQTRKKVIAF